MAVNEANITRYIKGGVIYTGCTVPGADEGPVLTVGVPAGGTDRGATQGVSTFLYNANITKVDIEQVAGGVSPFVTSETIALEFVMVEGDWENVKYALSQATEVDDGTMKVLQLGGELCVTGDCVAVVAPKACGATVKYYGGMVYDAYVAGERSIPVKRGEEARIAVRLEGNSVPTRAEGDQMGQWFEEL